MAGTDKEKALETALAQIERQFGKGSVMRLGEKANEPIDVIPTGSTALDVALGVGGILYQQSCEQIPPGATLVLYTDGLVETPGSDIDDHIGELVSSLDGFFVHDSCLEAAADHVLARLLPDAESHNDDVTLLLAQLPAAPLASVTTELPAVPSSVPEGREFLTALIVPNADVAKAQTGAASDAEAMGHPAVEEALRKVIKSYSRTAASHEKVRDLRVLTEPFTIENEMMTPKMSLKRKNIEKHYAGAIEEMYAGKDGGED